MRVQTETAPTAVWWQVPLVRDGESDLQHQDCIVMPGSLLSKGFE